MKVLFRKHRILAIIVILIIFIGLCFILILLKHDIDRLTAEISATDMLIQEGTAGVSETDMPIVVGTTEFPSQAIATEPPTNEAAATDMAGNNLTASGNDPTSSANQPEKSEEITHLDLYEFFDAFNTLWDYFKEFTISEIWIDGKAYYQLLCEEKDVKIVVDGHERNAVIYHNGKSMDYYMEFLYGANANTTIDLLDITEDGEDELIICHGASGTGVMSGWCDVINLSTMTEYGIEDFIYPLSSRIAVEILELKDDGLTCKITDINGHTYYCLGSGGYPKLEDYSYVPSNDNLYYDISVDYDKKCLSVSTGIEMVPTGNCPLGNVSSYMVYNSDTKSFELSEYYEVELFNEIYYQNGNELPAYTKLYYMKDSKNGWAITEDGLMFSTSDGWKSYSQISELTWNKEGIAITSIYYIDGTLFACGFMPVTKKIGVFCSKDSGYTWKLKSEIDYFDTDGGPGQVFLSFTDNLNGYVLYCGGPALGLMTKVLYSTCDGGETFQKLGELSGAIGGYPTGLSFTESGIGFIASTYHGNENAYLYSTKDNGYTWEPVILPKPEGFSDKGSNGYIDGYPPTFWGKDGIMIMELVNGKGRNFLTYVTSDEGNSWEQHGNLNINFLLIYSFSNKDTVFLNDSIGEIMVKENDGAGWK